MDRFLVLNQIFKIINPMGLIISPLGLVLLLYVYISAPESDQPKSGSMIFLTIVCISLFFLSYRYCKLKLGWFNRKK